MKSLDQPRFFRLDKGKRRALTDLLVEILRHEQAILFAFLHGSFLSEPAFRDIDVAIFLDAEPPDGYLNVELDLSQRIEDALECEFPVEVKIVNQAPLSFRFSVIQGSLLFTRNEDVLVDFMTTTARQYLDFAPLRRRYIKEAMAS